MKHFLLLTYSIILALCSVNRLEANGAFGYKLTTDVVYGEGKVEVEGKEVMRELKMDIYEPAGDIVAGARPAVVLVHGGAWHRGGRRFTPYEQWGGVHSMMEGYAKLLAPMGYVCFVIDYRLVPDNPIPTIAADADGLQDYRMILTEAGLDRLELVRTEMGLPLLTKDDSLVLWNGILAGAEDTKKAVDHIRGAAGKYGIDIERIALGGHSAGAANILNAAFGLKANVAAIFPLSPAVLGFDMAKTLNSPDFPAMLLMTSQNDLGVVLETTPGLLATAKEVGIPHSFAWVPNFAHFYPTQAVSLGSDGKRMSIGERVVKFLGENLK